MGGLNGCSRLQAAYRSVEPGPAPLVLSFDAIQGKIFGLLHDAIGLLVGRDGGLNVHSWFRVPFLVLFGN